VTDVREIYKLRWFRKLVRRLGCKRHRWRTDRRREGWEFCDLCRAHRRAPPAK